MVTPLVTPMTRWQAALADCPAKKTSAGNPDAFRIHCFINKWRQPSKRHKYDSPLDIGSKEATFAAPSVELKHQTVACYPRPAARQGTKRKLTLV